MKKHKIKKFGFNPNFNLDTGEKYVEVEIRYKNEIIFNGYYREENCFGKFILNNHIEYIDAPLTHIVSYFKTYKNKKMNIPAKWKILEKRYNNKMIRLYQDNINKNDKIIIE